MDWDRRMRGLPFVSIVIAVYNSEEYIIEAIQSALSQTYSPLEVIVVDDGSTDSTYSLAVKIAEKHANCAVFQQENRGASSARNHGFRCASPQSTYLFFLDADDMLVPTAIEKLVAYMEGHSEVGLLGCQHDVLDVVSGAISPGHRTRMMKTWLFPMDVRESDACTPFEVFFCATGQGPFALYRRNVFEKVGGWGEEFWGHMDTDMFIKMALEAPVHYIGARLYIKRKSKQSLLTRPGRDVLYTQLRQKWDNFECDDQRKMKLLSDARIYYYSWHKPLRDLKVSALAMKGFLRRPSLEGWSWFWQLFVSGVKGLLRGRIVGALRFVGLSKYC
jgi:glycosyltransferase involved in cell wall biosynthesis